MKHRRHSHQIYNSPPRESTKTLTSRKMFVLVDQRGNMMTHKEGNLLIFYRSKDARRFIERNELTDKWKEKRIQLDITTL